MIGLDCETYLIGARLAPRVVSVQFAAPHLEERTRLGHLAGLFGASGPLKLVHARETFETMLDAFAAYLADGGEVVGQNIAYDLACLIVERDSLLDVVFRAYQNGQIRDTMIREQLIAIALGQFRAWRFNLNAIVERRFGVKLAGKTGADIWRLKYHELEGVPLAEWPLAALSYAQDDASWTLKVYEKQAGLRVITDTGRPVMPLPDEKEQTAAAFALHLLSIQGVKVDRERAETWIATIEREARENLDLAREGGFLRENGSRNVIKIREMVVEGYDGAPPLTEKGSPKTDRDTLLGSGNSALIAYALGSKVQKLANTYAGILRDVDAVYPRYNVLRRSGRTSSEKPNFQQAPRDGRGFRECFVPRSGVFVSCDYNQIELVALAQILEWWVGTSAMADAVRKGRDLHVEVAAKLDGTTYEKMAERVASGEKRARDLRQFSKVSNYGYAGGLGSVMFCQYASSFGLDVTLNESAMYRRAWLEAWPEMRVYFDKIGLACKAGSITITQEVSKRQRGGVHFTSACNGFFQSLVADGAKSALFEVSRRCYTETGSALYGARPCAFLHDEIILDQVPEERAHEAALELSEVMVEIMARYIPDVPVSADPVLSRRWSKHAEKVVGADGRLAVWTP